MKLLRLPLALLIAAMAILLPFEAAAQILEPIKWKSAMTSDAKGSGKMTFTATIDAGWHLYGLSLPEDGPNPTHFAFSNLDNVELVGSMQASPAPIKQFDPVFELELNWWENTVTLTQRFRVLKPGKPFAIAGSVTFQGCNDSSCVPPATEEFEFEDKGSATPAPDQSKEAEQPKEAEKPNPAEPDTAAVAPALTTPAGPAAPTADITRWWTPVVYPDAAATTEAAISSASLWSIFAWGFIGGLIALLTPCVWPMIPLTVSFFLKKNRNRRQAIGDALTYGLSIIVIYLALGLVITVVFGASKLNELSTNAIFNLLFFAMLVVFAISFFGAFDIKLPSKWSNSADSRAEETSGLLSIFFMAFTLALVSFSCTGPIIGTLLVEAATDGNFAGPAVGMGAFALALAIPFALFAMFPSMLKEMPKSGGWLNSVKVVLGFLELALSLKFLSVADLAYGWGLLDREWFIALWIVIFFLLGIYLLGKISFPHDTPSDRVSIPRFFLALASLSFAVYLVPGLWGAPLKGVSAFVPPLYTQDFNLYESGEFHQFSDYDEGMAYAAANGKPVLIDFSGYGCVNCRKMEGAVFDTDVIRQIIEGNYVLITLMVDDKKELDSPMKVEENGKTKTLRTIGDKWSYLQRMKFGANTQPFYVVLDNSGSAMTSPYYYDEDVEKFGLWLTGGIDDYKKSGK